LPYLADHCVYDHAVLPAAAYLEMAVSAATRAFKSPRVTLEQVRIKEPLFVSDAPRSVQVVVSPSQSTFRILSLSDQESGDVWTLHAEGQVRVVEEQEAPASEPLAEITARCSEPVSKSVYYQRLHEQGLQYG